MTGIRTKSESHSKERKAEPGRSPPRQKGEDDEGEVHRKTVSSIRRRNMRRLQGRLAVGYLYSRGLGSGMEEERNELQELKKLRAKYIATLGQSADVLQQAQKVRILNDWITELEEQEKNWKGGRCKSVRSERSQHESWKSKRDGI